MTCDEFSNRLHELLDQRASLQQTEILQHVSVCDHCRAILQLAYALLRAVEVWRDIPHTSS